MIVLGTKKKGGGWATEGDDDDVAVAGNQRAVKGEEDWGCSDKNKRSAAPELG